MKKPEMQIPRRLPKQRRREEDRVCGVNACGMLFERRPDEIRKVYLTRECKQKFPKLLSYCTTRKIGFSLVEPAELSKITASEHHEGICIVATKRRLLTQEEFCTQYEAVASRDCIMLLDGVGNPHNFGAIIRSAAFFGAGAVLITNAPELTLSAAVYRTAEGGCELLTLARIDSHPRFLRWAESKGYTVYGTDPKGELELKSTRLSDKSIICLGAERTGLSESISKICSATLSVAPNAPIDSLNVGITAAILLWNFNSAQ